MKLRTAIHMVEQLITDAFSMVLNKLRQASFDLFPRHHEIFSDRISELSDFREASVTSVRGLVE
jgi:hypothetical protein